MWILGLSGLLGNLFSLFWRLKAKTRNPAQAVQSFLIANLAVSDFFMGVYMVIVASADAYYGTDYFNYSDQWRTGRPCRVAGFMSILSSEASVFFLCVISYERFMSAVFPFSKLRLTLFWSKMTVSILWLLTIVLSLVPILLAGPESDFYDLSDVCIGLPLITRPSNFQFETNDLSQSLTFTLPVNEGSKPAWYFSIVIFLGVNLLCFVGILVCYIAIFWSLKRSSSRVNRSGNGKDEMKMAVKMAVIVGTDFVCWMPVIIMGILSQTGLVVLPLETYTWAVVFVLPINSSLNPYLYTIASLVARRKNRIAPDESTMRSRVTRTDFDLKQTNGIPLGAVKVDSTGQSSA